MIAGIVRVASVIAAVCTLAACATQFRSEVHGDPNYDFGTIRRLAIRAPASAMPDAARLRRKASPPGCLDLRRCEFAPTPGNAEVPCESPARLALLGPVADTAPKHRI